MLVGGGGGCVEKPGVTPEGCVIGVGAAGVPNLSPGVLPSPLPPPEGAFGGMSRVEGDLRALPMAMLSKGSLLSFFSEKMVQTTGLEGRYQDSICYNVSTQHQSNSKSLVVCTKELAGFFFADFR